MFAAFPAFWSLLEWPARDKRSCLLDPFVSYKKYSFTFEPGTYCLERTARVKRSCLFDPFVSYKKILFYIGTRVIIPWKGLLVTNALAYLTPLSVTKKIVLHWNQGQYFYERPAKDKHTCLYYFTLEPGAEFLWRACQGQTLLHIWPPRWSRREKKKFCNIGSCNCIISTF